MKTRFICVILLAFLAARGTAQIPNSGFENWTSMGAYSNPVGWDQWNGMTNTAGVYTCERGAPGSLGASYLSLTSKTVTGMGVVLGMATNGILTAASMQVRGGSPYTGRPLGITGSWQYMALWDTGFISIYLTRWNVSAMKRDTIAFRSLPLLDMVMAWAPFSIGLIYKSLDYPDTAQIILSASGKARANSSYLYIDDLAFSGNVPGNSTGMHVLQKELGSWSVYPNPSADHFVVELMSGHPVPVQLQVIDGMGRLVKEAAAVNIENEYSFTFNTLDLPTGIYFLKVQTSDAVETRKIIIR